MVTPINTSPKAPGSRRTAKAAERSAQGVRMVFRCPQCKKEFGDPWYHGPIGHAPQRLCFECWATEWAMMDQVRSRGGNWQQLDSALFLLCQGFTHREAAELIGVSRNTVQHWIRHLRQRPEQTPEWLIDLAQKRREARR